MRPIEPRQHGDAVLLDFRGESESRAADAGGHHGDHQITMPAGITAHQCDQFQAADGAQHGGYVPVGQRAGHFEGLLGSDQSLALQHPPQGLDLGGWPVRDIGHGSLYPPGMPLLTWEMDC
jgi:hypothetical protein